MGDLIQIDKDGNITIQDLNEESREILRKQDPVLYLHLLYRNPNQFLIARFDGMNDLKLGINALEKLEHRIVLYDKDLNFIKRTYEIVALNGTLCQFKTFAARIFNNPDYLEEAKAHGMKAVKDARPEDLNRDRNYWILAVLTEWARFGSFDKNNLDEYNQLAEYMEDCLKSKPDDYFNTMIAFLTAAVEAQHCPGQQKIAVLLEKYEINPAHLQKVFESPHYNENNIGSYALSLAAGYAALSAPSMNWNPRSLNFTLNKAIDFFKIHELDQNRNGLILKIVGLKLAACLMFNRVSCDKSEDVPKMADYYLNTFNDLKKQADLPEELGRFFEKAVKEPIKLDRKEVLQAIMRLPY